MFYYAVFAAVTVLTIGSNGKPTKSLLGEPERCCAPKQFSSQISTSTGMVLPDGKTFSSYAYYNFSYDADRNMVGLKGVAFTTPDQEKSNLWIIENYNDGQMYTIYPDTKTCYKSTVPFKSFQCIPESATFIRSFTYGYGDKQIIGDTWLTIVDGMINYETVSRDGLCVPLTGHVFLKQPEIVSATTTTDFVPKITDPSVFDIPAECKTAV